MSIVRAINRAYDVMAERNWDTIYYALDLHGTCLKANYENGGYEFLPGAREALQYLSRLEETCLIVWSSLHQAEVRPVFEFLYDNGIEPFHFNSNSEVRNTDTGCFDRKFYFSVILDDKAGFAPEDWVDVVAAVKANREKYDLNFKKS